MATISTTRFLALECLPDQILDFRPLMELDYFLTKLPALQLADADYFFIGLKGRLYMARKVIGLVDEQILKPYEFLDFKAGELELIEEDISFLTDSGLIDLSSLWPKVQKHKSLDSYLLAWNLVQEETQTYGTKSSLYLFASTLLIS